ncbi:protein ANTAGONIST OF LIKE HETEROCHROMATIN PROTEIN 1-like [Chenopodium quinoa]|uniref:DDE Tnp4 domain-containing protein n=1 Tax=Chenopodium quinoa TaxID=63459 RepID=A0A803KMZ8_CHEQI|nr:protein ANTAGONIST OF LIKE HETEROCHROMATIN PROTEIN 1-like [Chenopodium quinoa]
MNEGGNNHSNGGRKRRKKNGNGVDESVNFEEKQQPSDKKETKEMMITSYLLLEDQEKQEKEEWEEFADQEKFDFEAIHKEKTQAMLDYNSNLQSSYEGLDETDRLRQKRSRKAVNSAMVVAASEMIEKGGSIEASSKQSSGSSVSHQRRLWVKDRSKDWWDKCTSPDYPESEFKRWFRMGKATFELICDELKVAVAKENTMLRAAIPVDQRVAVCIYRLATGEPLRLVSKRFGLGISTCHKIVLDVCAAIRSVLMPKYLQWPDEDSLRQIKEEFESISGIPNVVGSMYTTHIPIIAPKISVAAYFNKRHTERNQKTSYSITVQGVVDPRGVFNDVCIGWPGSMPDDKVLEKSALYQRGNQGLLKGVWIVGGAGYPLMDWILVPYNQQNLTWTQHAFNEKIGEIQTVSKDAFARLKGRWSCLQKRTEVKLQELPVVLGACCVLHNICEMRGEELDPELIFELFDDEMVPEVPLQSLTSMKARDSIAHNLLHHGLAGTGFL